VNLTTTNLADVGTRLLDFSAGTGDIHVIYADPFIMLAPLYGHFTDLNKFINDPTLPPVPNGIEDFDEMNMVGSGYMIDKSKLLAIPYDAPTMLLTYRTDIFENETYKQMFMDEKGYDWTRSKHYLGAVCRDRRMDQRKNRRRHNNGQVCNRSPIPAV
jgi:multiple sugar transport system substrate-binding protein